MNCKSEATDNSVNIEAFNRLYEIVKKLTSENGCPWDKVQTPLSLRSALNEEIQEVIDAISAEDTEHVKEELGDAFFNLILTSHLYEKQDSFTFAEVMEEISEKLIRRHPHVFGEKGEDKSEKTSEITSLNQINEQWDKIKREVEDRKTEHLLDEVPAGFEPLLKSYKYMKKVKKAGFDWNNIDEVYQKVYEELKEVKEAQEEVKNLAEKSLLSAENNKSGPFTALKSAEENKAQLHLEEEIGDLLLSVTKLSLECGVDPNIALTRANEKFYNRYGFVENQLKKSGKNMTEADSGAILKLWKDAKSGQ